MGCMALVLPKAVPSCTRDLCCSSSYSCTGSLPPSNRAKCSRTRCKGWSRKCSTTVLYVAPQLHHGSLFASHQLCAPPTASRAPLASSETRRLAVVHLSRPTHYGLRQGTEARITMYGAPALIGESGHGHA